MSPESQTNQPWQPYDPREDPELVARAQGNVEYLERLALSETARRKLEQLHVAMGQGETVSSLALRNAREAKRDADIRRTEFEVAHGIIQVPPETDT